MKIDIWFDVVCHFCYLGQRRLEIALKRLGITPAIEWHSFELDPNAPQTYGVSLPELLVQRYGWPYQQVVRILEAEQAKARELGLDYQWRSVKPGNTFDAHRLIHLAEHNGIGEKVKGRFMDAYFKEGQEIGDRKVLRQLAIESGLAANEVDDLLKSDRFADEVRSDESAASRMRVSGVPYFVINGKTVIPGAVDIDDFVRVLQNQSD